MESLEAAQVESAILLWIKSLLSCRKIKAEWNEARLLRLAHRGTPQGGVLSPLLWLLVANELLGKFEGKAPRLIAYADDIAIVVTGKFLDTISNVMESALRVVHRWATTVNLEVNADKTDAVLFTRRYKIPAWKPPRLNGAELSIKDHTKYLGVILDSKLMWKLNVEERVKKASGALYACKKMLGTTWGLSPGLMHWCYTAVVKPILLYGALVWWTAANKISYRKPLERLQRLAALCITGALRTTPTAALERLLGLPPIDIAVESTAAKSATRLMALGEFSARTFGHSSICRGMEDKIDHIPPRFIWGRRFKATVKEGGWRMSTRPAGVTYNIYTDGSKMADGVGAGVYCAELDLRQPFKLPEYCSIFQAEVFAVGKAAEIASNAGNYIKNINIYVDSQAAIKAIISHRIASENVLRSREAVDRAAESKRLHIYWVPGHKGILGNEIADEIAKSAIRLASEPVREIQKSLKTIYNEISERAGCRIRGRWNALATCKTTKIMCNSSKGNTHFLLTRSRRDCRTVVGLMTGHNLLASHASRMGISNSDACRKCREEGMSETLEHLLCFCPALARNRLSYLGASQFKGLEEVSKLDIKALLNFAKSVDVLYDDYFRPQ
ncbi:PREDICTED: uncharacterized protein LOC108358852 [Rhagoletis zephyria]|uniref:uncharacterized protein LOC108358852 n=1 Tax=Rhagoletis zephyria TaxID=28612 RepID=UPI00081127A1|nr:PREDICTED: uncharacterized protein LOC108358852 [Rhagoletis zephyria]